MSLPWWTSAGVIWRSQRRRRHRPETGGSRPHPLAPYELPKVPLRGAQVTAVNSSPPRLTGWIPLPSTREWDQSSFVGQSTRGRQQQQSAHNVTMVEAACCAMIRQSRSRRRSQASQRTRRWRPPRHRHVADRGANRKSALGLTTYTVKSSATNPSNPQYFRPRSRAARQEVGEAGGMGSPTPTAPATVHASERTQRRPSPTGFSTSRGLPRRGRTTPSACGVRPWSDPEPGAIDRAGHKSRR